MKQVIVLIVMMLCTVTSAWSQAFVDTFNPSNGTLTMSVPQNWGEYSSNFGGQTTEIGTSDGNLFITLGGVSFFGDTKDEKGIFRPINFGQNNWEISASMSLTSEMLQANDYSWSLNLRAIAGGKAIFVGAYDRIDSTTSTNTSPVWRVGEINGWNGPQNVWVEHSSVALIAGINNVSIRGFDSGYEVYINGSYLVSGRFISGYGKESLDSMGLSGFSFGELSNDYITASGGLTNKIQFGEASAQVYSGSSYSGAVPEPSTYALIVGAMALFVVLRKRQRKK